MNIVRRERVVLLALACSLFGCSGSERNDPNAWYNKTVIENLTGQSAYAASAQPPADAAVPAQVVPAMSAQPAYTVSAAQPGYTVPPAQSGYSIPPAQQASVSLPPQPPPAPLVPAAPVGAAPYGAVPPTELYRSEASCGTMVPGAGGFASADVSNISLQMTECEVARHHGPPDKVELGTLPNGARSLTLFYLRGPRPRIYHFAYGRLVAIENLPEPPPRDKRAVRQSR